MNASDYIDAVNGAIDALVVTATFGIDTTEVDDDALSQLLALRNAWDNEEDGNLG